MLGEENWRMHIQSFAHLGKQQGIVLLATGFIEDKEKEFFSKKDLMFIPSTKFLKKKICENMVIILMIQQVILMLKDVI